MKKNKANPQVDFEYKAKKKKITITGYKGKRKNVVIPSKIDGLPVVAIAYSAFSNYHLIDSWLSNPFATFDTPAFDSNQLTNVVIPDSVTTIGKAAFANNQLTNVIIPDSVTTIDERAFANNQLTNIVIPDSVTTIGERAFANNKLTNVVIPDSVTTIGEETFEENQLTNIIIPDSVKIIEKNVFDFMKKNSKLLSQDEIVDLLGAISTTDSIVTHASASDKIDNLLGSIPDDKILNQDEIDALLKAISTTDSDEVIIKKDIKTSSTDNFSYEVKQDGITITGLITDYKGKTKDVVLPDEIQGLPVVAIGDWAFFKNKLTKIVIPDSVEAIGEGAFADNLLTNIAIPDSVKIIDDRAFKDNRLTKAIIPYSVQTIGKDAFDYNVEIIRKIVVLKKQKKFL